MGRILEEQAADKFNRELVSTLKDIWDANKDKDADQFVNVADKNEKDPVIKDAWKTLGWKIKEDAAEIFGEDNFFPVRKEMVNDSIGYRAAGVTDPWTGVTRWSPETQKKLQGVATAILGKNAYTYLAKTEGAVGDLVSYAKTTIIVRSFVVARDNLLSNILQLSMSGVSIPDILSGLRNKFVEITEHVKNHEDIKKLEVDLAASIRNPTETKKIRARIQALEQANKRMSINPLIEAGEFSTISENLTEADSSI